MADKAPRKYNIKQKSVYDPSNRSAAQKRHFFLEGKLYKMLRQDRGGDLLTAWSFTDNKNVQFILSDAKRKMKNAYDTTEVAAMLNRSKVAVSKYISKGAINSPIRIYPHGMNAYGHKFEVMKWSDADILALHSFLLTNSSGAPRKDGMLYSAARIPTRTELLAMLRNQPMFYMKTSSGDFVPVWSAYNEV